MRNFPIGNREEDKYIRTRTHYARGTGWAIRMAKQFEYGECMNFGQN